MAAKKAMRWSVHYQLPGLFREHLFKRHSTFTVRGRNRTEAKLAAENHPRHRSGERFIVIPLPRARRTA